MRFDLTEEQLTIQRTVEDLLAARLTDDRLRALADSQAYDTSLWAELCELGFAGLAVPEEYGGEGLGMLELGLVCEALGFALAPVPLIAHAAAGLLLASTSTDRQRAHLPGIATGMTRGAFAVLQDGVDPLGIDVVEADLVVVCEGDTVWLGAPDDVAEPTATLDLLRRYAVVRGHGSGEPISDNSHSVVDAIEVMLAAELTGVAQRALDLAVAYACEREQFGRPIGSFQGVSHRCVEMTVDIETARSTWRYAAWVAGQSPADLPLAASTAKVAASTAACRATAGSLQVLGGIGFTWEHVMHLLLRRARVGSCVLGGPGVHRRRIARLLRDAIARERVALAS
jgi:alkylation response protein AidB-like acyl-CoA dehydrogenase